MRLLRSIGCSMAVLVGLAAAGPVGAQTQHCIEDAKKFCADVPPGGGRINACLRAHAKDLSPECRANLGKVRREAGLFVSACRNDITRFCQDTAPGGGRIFTCLQAHESELAPECRDAVQRRAKR